MNTTKIKAIVDVIRRRGALPVDEFGNPLPPEETIVLLGLSEVFSADEQRQLKRELIILADTQAALEKLEENMP